MFTPVAKRFSASVKRLLGGAGGRGKQVPFPVEFVTGPDAGRVITPSGKRPADLECLLASFIDVPASGNAVAIAVVDVAAQAVDHSDVLAEVSDSAAVSRCSAATASQRSADFAARPANVSARLAKVASAVAPSAIPAVYLSAGLAARQSRRARPPPSPAAPPPAVSTSALIAERAAVCPWDASSPAATATPDRPVARFRHAATSSTSSTSTAVSSTSTTSRLSVSDSTTTATSSTLSVPASLSSLPSSLSPLSSLRRPSFFKPKSRSFSVTSIAVSVSVDICSVPDFSLASGKY
ncbi:hypothetical protein K523DRAFT_409198 [Schizophyllum commune Tattone D]|nr:hypothetical protein K523DRAFT_409198 [Schizophyllum commune Tattone D]